MQDTANSPLEINNWDDLIEAELSFAAKYEKSGDDLSWIFRGENSCKFPESSLETHAKSLGLVGEEILDLEVKIIREFARSYHLYSNQLPPPKGATLQQMALLRHYGGPTRLVDFTYSFFNAVYFALARTVSDYEGKMTPVVWAICKSKVKEAARATIKKKYENAEKELFPRYDRERDGEAFRAIFMMKDPVSFVHPANPIRLNDRLQIQQGVFLAPGNVAHSFEQNMGDLKVNPYCVRKVKIDRDSSFEILRKLHRLGINNATLFPGLQGFAESLSTKSLILSKLPQKSVDDLVDDLREV